MQRYFLEIAYKGTAFQGMQEQMKGLTIQGEIHRALSLILKQDIPTTLSSRTDSGVHALQNYIHFDLEEPPKTSLLYNANAVIHPDIVLKRLIPVESHCHARFDATSRAYAYHIIQHKNPFLKEFAYYFPFRLDTDAMQEATSFLFQHTDFQAFSKKHTDVHTFQCAISRAQWEFKAEEIIFHVQANRFLRGMVRAIVGTLLQVGRKKISPTEFAEIIASKDCTRADFSAEGKGLFLEQVHYPFI